ncbi:hypothetical protein ACQP2H_30595 [Micromonospora sp. CA-248260]|uniref:hypothetical protein n=1 Tax=Micromonospora sp. CA-248260 TaxID=3239962 RepID=UPI003D8E65FC
MVAVDDHDVCWRAGGGEVVQDGHEVGVVEPAGDRREAESVVDLLPVECRGQFDGFAHLRPDPDRAGGAGFDEPPVGAFTQIQECDLVAGARPGPWWSWQVPAGVVRVVGVDDRRVTRC